MTVGFRCVMPALVLLPLLAIGGGCAEDDGAIAPPSGVDGGGSMPPGPGTNDGGGGGVGAGDSGSGADAGDATPSAGCNTTGNPKYPAGTTTAATVTVGARARGFRVHVPPGYSRGKAAPVVLVLHGGGGSAEQIELRSSKMDPVADREGFLAVYPEGTGVIQTWNGGLCCGKAAEDNIDDVAFVTALLDHLEGELCTDKRRVYATGMSNGAILSHRLACEMSSRIAAIAPVAGTIGVTTCATTRQVAVMQIHGSSDGHVPFAGGEGCGPSRVSFVSVPETMEGWRTRNGCQTTTTDSFQQGDGRCAAYEGCGAPVVLCTIQGGGHSWPGGEPKEGAVDCPADGVQSSTFFASEAAWTFFKNNPMR